MVSKAFDLQFLSQRDVRVLERVADEVFDQPIREPMLTRSLGEPGNLLVVALVGDTVVGMAAATTLARPDKAPQLYIDEVAVTPAHRRKGIAAALVRALLEQGRARGCATAWLATEQDNEAARALYRSLRAAEDATPAVVYTWALEPSEAAAE